MVAIVENWPMDLKFIQMRLKRKLLDLQRGIIDTVLLSTFNIYLAWHSSDMRPTYPAHRSLPEIVVLAANFVPPTLHIYTLMKTSVYA